LWRLGLAGLVLLALLGAPAASSLHATGTSTSVLVADGPPGTAGDGNGRSHS
jgi:hypothetical protein